MKKFASVSETQITSAIVREFSREFLENLNSDVIVIGAGPSGLMAAGDLAKEGLRVLLIEANNYLGGGFWIGGFLMNTLTFRAPSEEILREVGIPYKEVEPGLFISVGPHACARLILFAAERGVRFLNMAKCDDVIVRDNLVKGVVVNWSCVSALPRQITCVDPVAIEARLVIDATGHDASVAAALKKRGLIETKDFGPMDVGLSEDLVVEYTREVFPGLIACGMSVATVFGLPRMGPTFGGMLLSGRKAAALASRILAKETVAV